MSMSMTPQSIHTVGPDQRKTLPGPADLPFVRQEMFSDGHVWMGIVTTEPQSASPWHHHGEYETYVYMLEGEATLEFGAGGAERLHATADGSLHIIPPGLAHREINTGTEANRMFVIRIGEGPAVVPLDGPPE